MKLRGNSIGMLYAHLQSQVHPIRGMMVRVCSVWPTLSVWCVKFQIEGPSLFAIPSLYVRKFSRNVVGSSSFTGASNPGNDGSSVFRVAYSERLVRKISD